MIDKSSDMDKTQVFTTGPKAVLIITPDGRLEAGEGLSHDEVSRELFKICSTYYGTRTAELERENAKLRERIQQLESSKPEHWLPKSITVADIAAKAIALNVENDALLSELKRQRALWQATHALGLSERDFAIKCIETALAQKEEQP